MCFFNQEKLKETMSRIDSKFYVINFIYSRIIFFKIKFLTPRTMKTHIQILYKESKSEGRRCMQVHEL